MFGTEMRAEALTLPDLEQVLEDPHIKPLWYGPDDFTFDDTAFESHKETLVAAVDRFSAAQRLTFFCMVAEALEHIGRGLDPSVVERAGALQPLHRFRSDTEQAHPRLRPLTIKQDRLVDEVLADPLNQFFCCGELHTYDELVVHWAFTDAHDRSRKNAGGQHSAILISFDVLRSLRTIAEKTGIRRPTFATLNQLGQQFRCYSCRAWKPVEETWAYVTTHHVKHHRDQWFCENAWEVTVGRPAVSAEELVSRTEYARIDFSPKGFKRRH